MKNLLHKTSPANTTFCFLNAEKPTPSSEETAKKEAIDVNVESVSFDEFSKNILSQWANVPKKASAFKMVENKHMGAISILQKKPCNCNNFSKTYS